MGTIYSYKDAQIYCHHTVDEKPDPSEYPMHAHEGLEIFCFLSGKGSYRVEGNEYPLSPRDILIMRPAETHKLIVSPDQPYERVALHFPASLLPEEWQPLLLPFFDRPLGRGNLYAHADCPSLSQAFDDFDFSACRQQRAHILARLMRFLSMLSDLDPLGAEAQAAPYPASLVDFVNANLFGELSLDTVASQFRKSTSQISRDFRRATGSSVWEYVMIKRLLAARAMIRRGETAQKASEACGFGEYSSFFRAYKARFGHSPKSEETKT